MKNASFIEDWIEQASREAAQKAARRAARKARKEGLEEGEKREGQKNLLRIIDKRFGKIPYELPIKLEELSVVQIENLIGIALDADSLEIFNKHLEALQN